MFKKKYTPKEQEYLSMIMATAQLGMSENESLKMAQRMLDECIKEAEKLGMRGYDRRGDELIKDELYVSKRIKAGLTLNDILTFWNRDFVWLLAEEKMQNAIRLSVYIEKKRNMESQQIALICRKMFIYYGDPEKPQNGFIGEDADLYHEFAQRHETWRSKLSIEHIALLSEKYSTYNAMVRDLIRKGQL